MPFWRRSNQNPSDRPYHATDVDNAHDDDVFHLPTDPKLVESQETEPYTLPSREASVHEVRFFLYHLLTFKGHRIAKSWPQWVLETVAYWRGTGVQLRALNQDFERLVPKSAGHAKLDRKVKVAAMPSGDCRHRIAEVIENTIKKLKAKEEGVERLHREWQDTQRGAPALYRMRSGCLESPIAMDGSTTNPIFQQCLAPHQDDRIESPQMTVYSPPYPYAYNIPSPSLYTSSIAERIYRPPSSLRSENCQLSDMTQTSSCERSLRNTSSTSRTTPPGSLQDEAEHKSQPDRTDYAGRFHAIPKQEQLTNENLNRAYSPLTGCLPTSADNCASSKRSSQSTIRSTRSHQQILYSGLSAADTSSPGVIKSDTCSTYPDESVRSRTQSPKLHPLRYRQPKAFHSVDSLQLGLHKAPIEKHSANWLERQTFCPSVVALQGNLAPNIKYQPMYLSSMNYPHPNIFAPQVSSPTPSRISRARSVAPSIFEQFPTYEKTRVPVVSAPVSASRTPATASTDCYALQQGSYIHWKHKNSAERVEVYRHERDRMQGMVPSNLRGEGRDPAGPIVRFEDPATGMPFNTLVEVIEMKQTLDGKRRG